MRDLEDGPQHLVLLLAFVARIFGVLELVLELEQGIFDVLKAIRRRLAVLRGAYSRHVGSSCCWSVCCGVQVKDAVRRENDSLRCANTSATSRVAN
jgi:hypothetical protein